jgi:zinc transport system permease protein
MLAVFVTSALISMALVALQKRADLSSDALLGLLSHSALAIGLVTLAFMTSVRVDLNGLLFGDILAVSKMDIGIIYVGGGMVLLVLYFIRKSLFAATLNADLAEAEGMKPAQVNLVFMILLAGVIAIAMKIIGALLITAMLIIPAATARRLAVSPEQMVFYASLAGVIAVFCGLFGSLEWDTPSGPSIVVAGLGLFLLSLLPVRKIAGVKS